MSRRWTRGQRGYVLLVTLAVMTVLGILLASLGLTARTSTAMERWALEYTRLRAAARAGIHTAAAIVRREMQDTASVRADWMVNAEAFQGFTLGDIGVTLHRSGARPGGTGDQEEAGLGVSDEESRLNVNTATPEQLMGIAGFSSVIAEAVVRYRLEISGGASAAGPGVGPIEAADAVALVDGPFRSLDELGAVEGIDRQWLQDEGVRTWLTCVSSGRVNVNTAPREVLMAVGLRQEEADKLLSMRSQGIVFGSPEAMAGALSIPQDEAQEKAPDKDQDTGRWKRLRPSLTTLSHTFRLLAEAKNTDGSRVHWIEAGLFAGDDRLTFFQWRETETDPR